MLNPKTGSRKRRRYLTYDLEWSKGKWQRDARGEFHQPVLTLVGVYDGKRYRAYKTVTEFMDAEFTRATHGRWFYAHAGGLADSVFLLEYLADDDRYEIDASFSGSSAIIIKIKRDGMKWTLVDSYWLLRDKLANIAKFIGMEKGEIDFETEDMVEMLKYNRLDCVILHKAIEEFQENLWSIGGELSMTLASSAMNLFKRVYLKEQIPTNKAINDKVRGAYYASRVEVMRKKCEGAFYYDVNSSFPYAMTFPCPGRLIGVGRKLRDEDLGDSGPILAIAEVTVRVPYMDLPPLPFRWGGSVYFPTGEWRAWLTGVDLELMLKHGGTIVEVHEVLRFEAQTRLRDYAMDLYSKRLEAKRAGSTMEIVVYKLLLNSLYGKFGESREKTGLVVNPDEPPHPEDEETGKIEMLFPGAYLVTKEVDVAHEHVPVAAWITSIARRTLYERMVEAGDYFYCDTDGFATTNPGLKTGDELGELKLETVIQEGLFFRPKVYMLTDDKGRKKVKAKGFTLKPDYYETLGMGVEEKKEFTDERSVENFLKLLEGEPLEHRRFMRVRELFRDGEVKATERLIEKRFRNTAREKRKTLSNGVDTRPWTVGEIANDEF